MDEKEQLELETIISTVILVGVYGVIGYYSYQYWDILSDPKQVQAIVESFGIWAPVVLFAGEFLQVFIHFIPGQVLSLVGGYAFGAFWGAIINLFAVTLGSLGAFFIARWIGRPLMQRFIPKKEIDKFDHFFHKHGLILIFLSRTQPYFPNDLISFISGFMKKLKWWKFLIATFIGYIPHFFLLAAIGSELQDGFFSMKMVSYVLLFVLMGVIYAFRKPIYRFIHYEEEELKHLYFELEGKKRK